MSREQTILKAANKLYVGVWFWYSNNLYEVSHFVWCGGYLHMYSSRVKFIIFPPPNIRGYRDLYTEIDRYLSVDTRLRFTHVDYHK
jgi:hypothetical protein